MAKCEAARRMFCTLLFAYKRGERTALLISEFGGSMHFVNISVSHRCHKINFHIHAISQMLHYRAGCGKGEQRAAALAG